MRELEWIITDRKTLARERLENNSAPTCFEQNYFSAQRLFTSYLLLPDSAVNSRLVTIASAYKLFSWAELRRRTSLTAKAFNLKMHLVRVPNCFVLSTSNFTPSKLYTASSCTQANSTRVPVYLGICSAYSKFSRFSRLSQIPQNCALC